MSWPGLVAEKRNALTIRLVTHKLTCSSGGRRRRRRGSSCCWLNFRRSCHALCRGGCSNKGLI